MLINLVKWRELKWREGNWRAKVTTNEERRRGNRRSWSVQIYYYHCSVRSWHQLAIINQADWFTLVWLCGLWFLCDCIFFLNSVQLIIIIVLYDHLIWYGCYILWSVLWVSNYWLYKKFRKLSNLISWHTHTHAHKYTHTQALTRTHAQTNTLSHTHIHTHTHTHKHTHTH